MCGIAGIVDNRGVSRSALERMSAALEHRGPDASGFFLHCARQGHLPSLGLAHRRLTIIDVSDQSDQPMVDATGRYVLSYNGELYNYVELRAELAQRGHEFRTSGDTEVVLAAYIHWGPDCVRHFVGMWALSILDLERRLLYLSRDRFGIKPLFYTETGGALRFASEIKALLADDAVPREPNEEAVRLFLLTGRADALTESFFRGIFHLPPGHHALVPIDTEPVVEPQRYWKIPSDGHGPEAEEAVAAFTDLLRDAVRLHARADVPVGTCLSGGLDSSAIVCLAHELRRRGEVAAFAHRGFGYVPRDAAYSEQRYMQAVAGSTDLDMTYVDASPERALEVIPLVARSQDEPFGTASIVAQWFVFEAAREAGLKVMLDGQGADEVLGGYHAYLPMVARLLLRSWRFQRYARFAAEHERMLGSRPLGRSDAAASAVPLLRRLGDARPRALTPAAALLSADLRRNWHRADFDALKPRTINEILARATASQLPALLRFEDRNSMAHSIEARVPFLDHRLVELAFGLPGEMKIRGVETKHILRRALGGMLPPEVRERTDKVGFRSDPGLTWTFAERHLGSLLSSANEYEARWFDETALSRALHGADRSPDAEFALWRVISAKLWLRQNWG